VKLGEGDHLTLFLERDRLDRICHIAREPTEPVALQKKSERIELAEFTGLKPRC